MRAVEIGIVSVSEHALAVSIDYHGDAAPLVRQWRADRRVVDGICADIEEAVAEAVRAPEAPSGTGGAPEAAGLLRSLGLALFQEMLKDECDRLRDFARAVEGRETCLVFKIDKSLAYLPLELVHDGREFLARRFAIGRVIYADSAGVRAAPKRKPPYTVLIIGDPSEDARISQDVEDEIDALRDIFKRSGDYSPRIAVGDEAGVEYILSNLPGAAIFHFSGHGVVSPSGQDHETGLRLANRAILSGYSLQGLQEAPALAFLNVCTPASHETWKGSLGIVETLLRRGTKACVSSLWQVRSKSATVLASHFYAHLLEGRTFGESLRLAREATADETGPCDPTWAAYALYGDPRMRLIGEAAGEGAGEVPGEAPVEEAGPGRGARRGRSRWAAFLATLALACAILVISLFLGLPQGNTPGDFTESTGTSFGRAAVQETAAKRASEVGYLVVESSPNGADVLVDGRRVGVTPCACEVAVGRHELVLEKKGYRRWEASAEVKVTPRATVSADLEKIK